MADPKSIDQYFADPVLANSAGHQVLADMLIAYLQTQVCSAWSISTGAAYDSAPLTAEETIASEAHGLFGGVGQRKGVAPPERPDGSNKPAVKASSSALSPTLRVPPGRINTRPNAGRPFEEIAPFCVSANDLINPLPPSLFYGSGWSAQHPEGSSGASSAMMAEYYWYSTLPTSKLRIPVQIGAGDVGIYYLRAPIKDVKEGAAVECWVDDNYAGAKVIENAADVGEETPA